MRYLNNCCCGCSLRTGTLIIGSCHLILSSFYVLGMAILLAQVYSEHHENGRRNSYFTADFEVKDDKSIISWRLKPDFDGLNGSVNNRYNSNEADYNQTIGDSDQWVIETGSISDEILIAHAVNAAVTFLTSVLLIIGAARGYIWLILPWIANAGIQIIISLLTSIYDIIEASQNWTGGKIFAGALVFLIIGVLHIYLIMVVVSHCEELRRNKRKENHPSNNLY